MKDPYADFARERIAACRKMAQDARLKELSRSWMLQSAKHRSAGTSHLAARMSQKRKRKLRGTSTTNDTNSKIIAYSSKRIGSRRRHFYESICDACIS